MTTEELLIEYNRLIEEKNPVVYHLFETKCIVLEIDTQYNNILTADEVANKFNNIFYNFLDNYITGLNINRRDKRKKLAKKENFLFSIKKHNLYSYTIHIYDRVFTFQEYEKEYEKLYNKELKKYNKQLKQKEYKNNSEKKLYERLKKKFENDS